MSEYKKYERMLEDAYNTSYQIYMKKGGEKSTEKVNVMHNFIADLIRENLNQEKYVVLTDQKGNTKKLTFKGTFMTKRNDISLFSKDMTKTCARFYYKNPCSSFGKNIGNYTEALNGELNNNYLDIINKKIKIFEFYILFVNFPLKKYSEKYEKLKPEQIKQFIDSFDLINNYFLKDISPELHVEKTFVIMEKTKAQTYKIVDIDKLFLDEEIKTPKLVKEVKNFLKNNDFYNFIKKLNAYKKTLP